MTMTAANPQPVRPELVEGPVSMEILSFRETLRRDMRPTAHSLSFASPKESKQRKGDPESGGPGVPGLLCAARARREVQKLALRAQTSELLFPSRPALLDASNGGPKSQHQRTARLAAPNVAAIRTPSTIAMRSEPKGIGSWAPLRRAEQRSGRRRKKRSCLSPQGEFCASRLSRAAQGSPEGAEEPGSPFLCLLSFGEAKESECAVGRTSRRSTPHDKQLRLTARRSATSNAKHREYKHI
jgi:hypothetical protein